MQISADDVVGQSLKPESSLNGMSPSQLVSISSSSREHLKTLKSKKIDPNLYKVAKAVTGKCSKPQIDAIKAVRKYSCQNFLAT